MPDSSSSVRPLASLSGGSRPRSQEVVLDITTGAAPTPVDARLVLLKHPSSARADAFRLARHRLQQRNDPRLLAVTSAAPGEGKTTLAANLALAIAEEHGPSVVLLDTHRARPALAELFGVAPGANVLVPGPRGYPLHRVEGTELLVGLGSGQPGPMTQADRDALRVALTDLRLVFDYVLVDCGPALDGMDVHWIGELVDGVAFAVRRGATDRRSLRRAIDGLMPIPLAGAVLLDD